MAYSEKMVDRVREIISVHHKKIEEKKMFGGVCFMVNDKMCVGVNKERIMVRFDPARNEEIMEMEGCRPMDFTSRTMKGFVFVDEKVLSTKKKLEFWVNLALEYNKEAKSSKKPTAKTAKKK